MHTKGIVTVNVQHHSPTGGPDALMETEPNFTATSKWIVTSCFGSFEKGSTHRGVTI